tara:strand:+ start:361 stop:591 length:231 start_codon:yes stop_codon:yes gene_type:complete
MIREHLINVTVENGEDWDEPDILGFFPVLFIQSNLLQPRIYEGPSKSNTIYSIKISYRGPKVGICSILFNLGAAKK